MIPGQSAVCEHRFVRVVLKSAFQPLAVLGVQCESCGGDLPFSQEGQAVEWNPIPHRVEVWVQIECSEVKA